MRSVVGKPVVLTVAPTMPRAAAEAETEAGAGAEPEPEPGAELEPEPAWPEPKGAARPALRVVAERTAAMLEERMAQVSGE